MWELGIIEIDWTLIPKEIMEDFLYQISFGHAGWSRKEAAENGLVGAQAKLSGSREQP